jgi:signal transduction histidine kinase/DNA-binding response OmpR family regulator
MENIEDGRVLLTGSGGLNLFDPDSVLQNRRATPPLAITRMSINDRPVVPASPVDGSGTLPLSYHQDVIELEFAALDIDAPQLVEYRYRLEGLENEWVEPKGRRFVRYPGLRPGEYVFRVRAASSRGEWPEQEIALAISIAPPWWQTRWAYAGYVMLLVGVIAAGYRIRMKQLRLKQQAEMEHFQAERLAEVDRLKSRFFANISHEFRTPLTLILGPAEDGMEANGERTTRERFRLIRDNARKLLALVSQLLDFSHVESGMMKLQVSRSDIVPFLRRTVMSFESWAEKRKIDLDFRSENDSASGFFDKDKLEKILNNLMSNALKFTPEGGSISVSLQYPVGQHAVPQDSENRLPRRDDNSTSFIEIAVSDTGPGISAAHLSRIFDRFYRVDDTHTTEGTGIGLALTRELVELHHGRIVAESTPGKGSVFTVTLPIEESAYRHDEISASPLQGARLEHTPVVASPLGVGDIPTAPSPDGKPIVLVVEDNADLRSYVRMFLEADYAVHEAKDGKEGYDQAIEMVPDLVVSDLMMPRMDGMELCRALKQDVKTSHVPVILLTARAGTESKIEGLETGADDYVTKPFDSKELMARVRNLIEQRRLLRKKFSAGAVLRPGEVAVTSLDDALLKKVMNAVEKNMGNEDFGVDDLAAEACLSQRQLSRKLFSLTNLSPVEFIRYIRLERARELLEKNSGTVAEIAFQVGFGGPSYFTSCFRERFGCSPSEVRHQSS